MGLLKLKSLGSAGGTTHPQPAHRSSEENVRGSNREPSISMLLAVGLAVGLVVVLAVGDLVGVPVASGLALGVDVDGKLFGLAVGLALGEVVGSAVSPQSLNDILPMVICCVK